MKILVCLKQILDPEIPVRDFRVVPDPWRADLAGANLVTNIFCENALEMALQWREQLGEGEITVACLGGSEAEDTLRKALAMQADHAVRLDCPVGSAVDGFQTASVLAAGVRKLGGFDLILLGREAGDWGMGQTGAYLAETLETGLVSFGDQFEKDGDGMIVRRQTDEGWERIRTGLPAVVTVTNNDDNLPRIPKTRDIMKSARKPIQTLTAADLGIDAASLGAEGSGCQVEHLEIPEHEVACELAQGESLEEKVDDLAERIAAVVRGV